MFVHSLLGLFCLAVASVAQAYQSLTLPNTDITFAYIDSGPVPQSSSYTTLVLIHGMGFNSLVFQNMSAIAAAADVRIVAVNRREYAPTSLLTEDELAVLSQGDAGAKTYFQQRGNEMGLFVDQWLQKNQIPIGRPDGKGGLVVVGWSLGTVTATAFLAHLDTLPQDTLNRLAPYIHTVLLHDPFTTAIAFPNPPEFDISLWFIPDPVTKFAAFKEWVTGYYEHSDANPATGSESTLDYNYPDPDKAHTFDNTPSNLLNTMLDEGAFAGSETTVLFLSQSAYSELMRAALFDPTVASKLPNVRVRYFYGAETPGMLVLANWEITEASPSYYGGQKARNIKLSHGDHGNHFLFYDYPEWALEQYLAAINS